MYTKEAAEAYVLYMRSLQPNSLDNESLQKMVDALDLKDSQLENVIPFADYTSSIGKRIEGAICTYKNKTFILFMATNSLGDWITNFVYFLKKNPYNDSNSKIKMHSGYGKRYQLNSVRTKILLEVAKRGSQEVVVTGYSMGGGIAPICAVDLGYNFRDKKVYCYAFAGPRVGNKAFVESVDKYVDAHHYSYGNDPVPKVPFVIMGFHHLRKAHHYGEKKRWWKFVPKHHYPHLLFESLFKTN